MGDSKALNDDGAFCIGEDVLPLSSLEVCPLPLRFENRLCPLNLNGEGLLRKVAGIVAIESRRTVKGA